MSTKILLTFGTSRGNKSSLSIDDPKDGLTESTVRTAMEEIISADVFEKSAGEGFTTASKAVVIETNETKIM